MDSKRQQTGNDPDRPLSVWLLVPPLFGRTAVRPGKAHQGAAATAGLLSAIATGMLPLGRLGPAR